MADHASQELDPREVRIGRILSDMHERRQRGEAIDDQQLLSQHPDLADELRAHLATLRQLKSDEGSITRLIRQGVLSHAADQQYRASFGDYQVIDYLGHGGMGIVLKAYDEKLRRVVAIKLLRRDLADDNIANARFLREARAAAVMSHPNIVSVYAIGERDGSQFIAMEYVGGPSISQMIRKVGPLQTETIRSLFAQLLTGLAAAHGAGLTHRDIKSANLLLVEGIKELEDRQAEVAGLLKIADFGLASISTAQTRLTMDNQSFGTPEFMSPEQARGDADIDHRTDLYSAGVVLFEMLTGRTPFHGPTSSTIIRQILDVTPPDPRSMRAEADGSLSSLALRLMAKRREDRFSSAEAVWAALETNQPVTSWEKWRRRGWAAVTTLLAMSAVGGVAWVSRSIGPSNAPTKRLVAARSHVDEYLDVMFEGQGQWQLLHSFPKPICVNSAAVADVDGHGDRIAIAAINPPENGDCLIAFEDSGRERWRLNLYSSRQWPDCAPPKGFSAMQVLARPLDDQPGDELIVVASDINEYPTRVSIIDPRSNPPKVLGTFWNLGDIGPNDANGTRVQILDRFFEDKRPAILIEGLNNKLDGFSARGTMAPQFWTSWNIVSAVMILDPEEIIRLGECVGPPATDLVELPRGGAYSYAFIDISFDTIDSAVSDAPGRRTPRTQERGGIFNVQVSGASVTDGSGPWFVVQVESADGTGGIVLHLDRNLDVKLSLKSPSTLGRSEAEWRMLWVPVVQGGRWLEPQERR